MPKDDPNRNQPKLANRFRPARTYPAARRMKLSMGWTRSSKHCGTPQAAVPQIMEVQTILSPTGLI
jgi:hypothetical protein